jgi:hypothetical protein
MARIVAEISLAYHQGEWIVDQRSKIGALEAGHRAPNGRTRFQGRAELSSLFDLFVTTRSLVLVFVGAQRAPTVARQWREIERVLAAALEQPLEAYLVPKRDAPEGVAAEHILQDVTGGLHQRCDRFSRKPTASTP